MPVTYKRIATVEVTTATAANIEFTNIPQTYDDLVILVSARSDRTGYEADDLFLSFNGVTTNLNGRRLYARNTTISTGTGETTIRGWSTSATTTSSIFGNTQFYIINYRSSNNKSVIIESTAENDAANAPLLFGSGLWASSSAITSILIDPDAGNLIQRSTASLYGITKF